MLPLILLGLTGLCSTVGISKGVAGYLSCKKAKKVGDDAAARYRRYLHIVESARDGVNRAAKEYGNLRLKVYKYTLARLVKFLENQGKKARLDPSELLIRVKTHSIPLPEYKAAYSELAAITGGLIKGGVAGASAASAI